MTDFCPRWDKNLYRQDRVFDSIPSLPAPDAHSKRTLSPGRSSPGSGAGLLWGLCSRGRRHFITEPDVLPDGFNLFGAVATEDFC